MRAPKDDSFTSAREGVAGLHARVKAWHEEDERRTREDPEYRARRERIEAERRQEEAAEKRRDERERRNALAKKRREKGIPVFTWPFLDAFRAGCHDAPGAAAKALQWVRDFIAGRDGWWFLFLAGTPGLGKTVAAAWFADAPWTGTEPDPHDFDGKRLRQMRREVPARFVTAEELAKKGSFGEGAKFWEEIRNTSRLVIDDLGVERLDEKGWALEKFVGLLSHRHARKLPTVITMNISRAVFEQRYAAHDGGRLRDRLGESGWFVALEGASLRRRLQLEEGRR